MVLPALLVPVLYSAGFGAIVDGLISAITASGDATPEVIDKAKQEFIASGLPDDVAQRMAEDVANEVTAGDRVQAGLGGAARGALTGAVGGAAIAGVGKVASAIAPRIKSFLSASKAVEAAPGEGASSLNPAFAPGRMPAIGQTKPVSMNAPGPTAMPMVDDAIPGASTELMSGIPGARSSLRAVPVGPPTGGAHPMDGASSKLGKLVQGDVWPEEQVIAGRIGMRSPKTIDTTAELVNPGIGMADDALLNAEIDQIVQAAMGKSAPRIGYSYAGRVKMPKIDPTQGAMSIPSFLR